MQLSFIKTNACPVCGETKVIAESVETDSFGDYPRIREHCNGGRWEARKFLCGYEVKYCPNGSREEKGHGNCTKDPAILERNKKRRENFDKAIAFIDSLNDIDESFKDILSDRVSSCEWMCGR